MKLPLVTSFFLFITLIFFNESIPEKKIKYQEPSSLTTIKEKILQKIEAKEYDSVIYYGTELRKKSIAENELDFVQFSNDKLSKYYGTLRKYDSAIAYGHKLLKLAVRKRDTQLLKKAYTKLFIYHSKSEIKDSALYFIDELHDLATQIKDSKQLAKVFSRKGFYFNENGKHGLAYKNFVNAKNLYEKLEDSTNVAKTLIDISNVEKKLGDLPSSQLSAIQGLTYITDPKKIAIISKLYYSIAVAAKEQGNLTVAERRINQALNLAQDSIAIKKIGLYSVIKFYNTRANIFKERRNFDQAIKVYTDLLNGALGELPVKEEARINGNLAHTLFLKEGFNEKSDSLLKKSLKIYEAENYDSGLIAINIKLAELYRKANKRKAVFYTNEAIRYARSLNNDMAIYEALQNKILLDPNPKHVKEYVAIELRIEEEEDKMQSQFANAKYDFEKEENKRIKAENQRTKAENGRISAENKATQFRNRFLTVTLILLILIVVTAIIYQRIKRQHKIEKVNTVHVTEARISSKVHDELANDLYKLISQLETTDPEKEVILDKLDIIYKQARDISKQIQRVDTGKAFTEELKSLFQSYQSEEVNVLLKRYDTAIWNGVSAHIKETIYRVLQELLTNMKKHSNAALVVVSIEKQNKQLFIQYIDNGQGFTQEISKNGLQNAENRIHAIQGKLTFDTELHNGCKFSINVPV